MYTKQKHLLDQLQQQHIAKLFTYLQLLQEHNALLLLSASPQSIPPGNCSKRSINTLKQRDYYLIFIMFFFFFLCFSQISAQTVWSNVRTLVTQS